MKIKSAIRIILMFALLLQAGTSQAQDIFSAARENDTLRLTHYLQNHVRIDTTDGRGSTPLIIAVYNDHEAAVNLLLTCGADPNAADLSGNTALMGACYKGYFPMVRKLLEHQARVDQRNLNQATALIFAATFGHVEIVKLLIDYNARLDLKDRFGKTALDYAAGQDNNDIVELIRASSKP